MIFNKNYQMKWCDVCLDVQAGTKPTTRSAGVRGPLRGGKGKGTAISQRGTRNLGQTAMGTGSPSSESDDCK